MLRLGLDFALLSAGCSGGGTPGADSGALPTETGTVEASTGETGHTGGAVGSRGLWVSAPVGIDGFGLSQVVGSPSGWLLLDGGSGPVSARRVAPDGSLVDPVEVQLTTYTDWWFGLWTGTEFAVVSAENVDYYLATATLELRRLPPTGPIAPVSQRLGDVLGWPQYLAGACDGAGACVVTLRDWHPDAATIETLRLSFDATGWTSSPTPFGDGEVRNTLEAVRDADRTLLALGGSPELIWLPDDPTLLPESPTPLEVPGSALAVAADGTVLVVWSHYDGDGDSGLPAGEWSVRAQRFRYGTGALDAAPIELGGGTSMDVAFDGTAFVVALDDDDLAHLVRVDLDGVAGERIAVPEFDSPYGRLTAGAPGHLLWGSTWTLEPASYVRVEIDVPEGGACMEDASCLSGACDAGVCVP